VVFERFYFRPDVGDGIDIFNLFDIRNGEPVGQFKAAEPFDIRLIEPISGKRVLVVADFHGTVLWDIKEKYVYEWALKDSHPEYICPGPAGMALLIEDEGSLITSLDTEGGKVIRSIASPGKVVGKPVFDGSRYLVPVLDGILLLDSDLKTAAFYTIAEGLKEARLVIKEGFTYLCSPDGIMRFRFDSALWNQ